MPILSLNAARFTAIDACSIANIHTFKAILIDLFTEIETRQKELPRLIFGQYHVHVRVRVCAQANVVVDLLMQLFLLNSGFPTESRIQFNTILEPVIP